MLDGFFNHTRIPVRNPIDVTLFKHDFGSVEVWYAATLQQITKKNNVHFILYKYEVYIKLNAKN